MLTHSQATETKTNHQATPIVIGETARDHDLPNVTDQEDNQSG